MYDEQAAQFQRELDELKAEVRRLLRLGWFAGHVAIVANELPADSTPYPRVTAALREPAAQPEGTHQPAEET